MNLFKRIREWYREWQHRRMLYCPWCEKRVHGNNHNYCDYLQRILDESYDEHHRRS